MYIVISALDPGVFGLLIPHLHDSKSYQIVWKILMMVYAWTCYSPFFVAALLRINNMVSIIGQTADAWITILVPSDCEHRDGRAHNLNDTDRCKKYGMKGSSD